MNLYKVKIGKKVSWFLRSFYLICFPKVKFSSLNTLIFHARSIFLTLGGHLLLIQLSFLNIQPSKHGPSSVSSPSVLLALSGLPDFTVLLRISRVKIKSCYFIQGLEQSWACVKNYIAVFTKNFFFYSKKKKPVQGVDLWISDSCDFNSQRKFVLKETSYMKLCYLCSLHF